MRKWAGCYEEMGDWEKGKDFKNLRIADDLGLTVRYEETGGSS
jgi:hypothetical protein